MSAAETAPVGDTGRLPRLLLLSDVTASETVAGELLLYRLLGRFPAENIFVMEGDVLPSRPETRLPGVEYATVRYLPPYYRTRLRRYWNTWLLRSIRGHVAQLEHFARARNIDAVLTVAHGHLWIAAAEVAKRLNVPLHLIVHDDWPTCVSVVEVAEKWPHRLFGKIYREATSRLCVSPFMEKEYRNRYGCEGDILLPCRGPNACRPQVRVREHDGRFVMAYAGSLHTTGIVELIRLAAAELYRLGGEFHIYSNADADGIQGAMLNTPGIRSYGYLSPDAIINRLGETADALFLPMSFRESLKTATRLNFPSKLTDYTAVGVPIVIWGPEYCSAVCWAQKNPGVAMCVTNLDARQFRESVRPLIAEANNRRKLAQRALEVGDRDFGFERHYQLFIDTVYGTSDVKSREGCCQNIDC